MLSAIILVPAGPASKTQPFGPLLRTLAALVPTTIEGAIRDVTLLDVGESADVANIADIAGCGIVQAATFGEALGRGLVGARAAWICVLRAGTVLGPGFGEDVAAALDDAGDPPRSLLLRGGGTLARFLPRQSTVAGVIAPKSRLAATPCGSFADVIRRARPSRALARQVASF